MAISPKQFISTTRFHQNNLQEMLEKYIDLPEAPGILVCMMYMQRSLNAAQEAAQGLTDPTEETPTEQENNETH